MRMYALYHMHGCLHGSLCHTRAHTHSPRGVHSSTGAAQEKGVQCTPLYYEPYALPYTIPRDAGPIQWARGDVGLKPSAAARPLALTSTDTQPELIA